MKTWMLSPLEIGARCVVVVDGHKRTGYIAGTSQVTQKGHMPGVFAIIALDAHCRFYSEDRRSFVSLLVCHPDCVYIGSYASEDFGSDPD